MSSSMTVRTLLLISRTITVEEDAERNLQSARSREMSMTVSVN
jgi:hypothetical protein